MLCIEWVLSGDLCWLQEVDVLYRGLEAGEPLQAVRLALMARHMFSQAVLTLATLTQVLAKFFFI